MRYRLPELYYHSCCCGGRDSGFWTVSPALPGRRQQPLYSTYGLEGDGLRRGFRMGVACLFHTSGVTTGRLRCLGARWMSGVELTGLVILRQKNRPGGITLPGLTVRHKAVTKAVGPWHKTDMYIQGTKPWINPHICGQLIFGKGIQHTEWGNDCFFNKEKKWRHRCREQRHDCQGAGEGAWEIRIDIYVIATRRLKYETNENLLCSTGNSRQCSLVTWMGRKSKTEGDLCARRADPPCCTAETDPTL